MRTPVPCLFHQKRHICIPHSIMCVLDSPTLQTVVTKINCLGMMMSLSHVTDIMALQAIEVSPKHMRCVQGHT